MARMIGKHVSAQGSCPYGCCTVYGRPTKKNLRTVKRIAKRQEKRSWQSEAKGD